MDIKLWTPVLVSVILATGSVQAMADSAWSYDEGSQTIIFAYSGSPVPQSPSHPEDDVMAHTGSWYYDEGSDTIVYNGEGSRDKYVRSNPSNLVPVFNSDLAYLDL
jgi:hypothetical protein